MSKAKPKGKKLDLIGLPGLDAFGNLENFDLNNVDDDDDNVDDDELERELMAIESNKYKPKERSRPQKSKNELQDLNKLNLDKLLSDDVDDNDLDVDDDELENELKLLSREEEEEDIKPKEKQVSPPKQAQSSDLERKIENGLNLFKKKLQDATNSSDETKMKRFKRIVGQYDDALKACKNGKTVNYDDLPPIPGLDDAPPAYSSSSAPPPLPPFPSQPPIKQTQALLPPPVVKQAPAAHTHPSTQPTEAPQTKFSENRVSTSNLSEDVPNVTDAEMRAMYKAPQPAKTTLEALDQLSSEFKKKLAQATETEDSAKKRRYQRFIKQVEDAIKATKLGKEYDYKELEQIIPPGFAPIPLNNGRAILNANTAPTQQPRVSPQKQTPPQQQQQNNRKSIESKQPQQYQNKDLIQLKERQRLFKEAALKAKQEGNQKLALLYLKNSKGFDQMILAAENGLPIDMTSTPKPPQMIEKLHNSPAAVATNTRPTKQAEENDWEIVNEEIDGDSEEIFKHLETDLRTQIKIAATNSQHFTSVGDVHNATKFKNIEKESLKDLNGLLSAAKHGDQIPKYHYEKRKYQMVNCCADLTDNDLEINLIRGINYPIATGFDQKNFQTYVKFEFPFPDETQSDKTGKQTGASPDYNQKFMVQIQRQQSKFLRIMNRKDLKLEIYYKQGFLKSDKLLATANVKLQPLEEKCVLHEAYDLFDGRKQLNGKIEVELRIREPLVHKEIKTIEEKWLIIDKFMPSNSSRHNQNNKSGAKTNSNYYDTKTTDEVYSLEILNFDRSLIEKQIETYKDRLNHAQLMELLEKSEHLNQLLLSLKDKLKSGGIPAINSYLESILLLPKKYDDLAKQCEALDDENKKALNLKRKTIVESEIVKIKSRLN